MPRVRLGDPVAVRINFGGITVKHLIATAVLLALLISLSGCIVIPVTREEVHHHYYNQGQEVCPAPDANAAGCGPLECPAPPM